MKPRDFTQLSRRERQIMDILHRRGEATASEVMAELADPPSYSAVRALLRVLEQKGRISHSERGRTYVFRPTASRQTVRRQALRHLIFTFFGGSAEAAASALLDLSDDEIDSATRKRLARRIAAARREGR
jgi:BlaI family transcriptional regulator, penicillinase repressor